MGIYGMYGLGLACCAGVAQID